MKQLVEKFGRRVRLTNEREQHIMRRKEMKGQLAKVSETLKAPNIIKRSTHDHSVYMYYRHYPRTPVSEKYMLVVAKMQTRSPFIITAFFTDKIKRGETIWERS